MTSDRLNSFDHDEHSDVVQSKAARAGKRTYFFDVKETQSGDYYLVITESRRRFNEDGSANYTRNHIYLYKEDFDKFVGGMSEKIEFIKTQKPEYFEALERAEKEE